METESSLKLHPPRRVTIVESIIEQIVSLIQDGTLKPGDKLPAERKLMDMLGVSRSSVREALQGLTAMGLVEVRAGEGTFVRKARPQIGPDMDIDTLSTTLQMEMRHHLNQARLILETDIVSLAAEQGTPSDHQAIMAALAAYEDHANRVSEEMGWPAHDQIHVAIAEATQNPILVLLIRTLLDLVPRPLRDRGLSRGTPEQVAERIGTERHIHRQLCEAVTRGDAGAARHWVERHAAHENKIINESYGEAQ